MRLTAKANIQLSELDLLDLIFTRYCMRNLFNLKRRVKELGFSEDIIGHLENSGAIEIELAGPDEYSIHFKRVEYRKQPAALLDGSRSWMFKFKNKSHEQTTD